jgi:hypothetical protein
MKVIESDKVVVVDVDDTLVIHGETRRDLGIPDEVWNKSSIEIGVDDIKLLVMPHEKHIEFIRLLKAQGSQIVVWSHGGYAWARAVIIALDIELYVDYVMSKPSLYIDDLNVNTWFPRRIWHHPINPRKREFEPK